MMIHGSMDNKLAIHLGVFAGLDARLGLPFRSPGTSHLYRLFSGIRGTRELLYLSSTYMISLCLHLSCHRQSLRLVFIVVSTPSSQLSMTSFPLSRHPKQFSKADTTNKHTISHTLSSTAIFRPLHQARRGELSIFSRTHIFLSFQR